MTETLSVNSLGPLGHCWGSGNRLTVYSRPSRQNEKAEYPSVIHEIKWGTSMCSDEFMRRLCKSSFDIFRALQKNTKSENFISSSMQYRAALAVCSQEIIQFLKFHEDVDDAKTVHLAAEYELIQCFELVWHLAELAFIQVFPTGHLTYNLCCWFYIQHQEAADNARILMELGGRRAKSVVLQRDIRFWPTVLLLVMQARVHDAASLLALHSHSNSRGMQSLRQLLVAMPVATQSGGRSAWSSSGVGFAQAWNYWQMECEHRLSSGDFDEVGAGGDSNSSTFVPLLVSILAGRTDVWHDRRIIQLIGSSYRWYFLFVAYLFYTNQLVSVDELAGHLDQWLAKSEGHRQQPDESLDTVIDQLIMSIFRLDLPSFVCTASEKLTNWWLVAHFINLIHCVYPDLLVSNWKHTSPSLVGDRKDSSVVIKLEEVEMDQYPPVSGSAQRQDAVGTVQLPSLTDFFLIGYAEAVASDTSLLPIALGYLGYCQGGRARQASLLLTHAVPVSTRAINWFMSQAKSRGLDSVSEQVASIAARRILPLTRGDRVPSITDSLHTSVYLPACAAMGWALLACDHLIVERISELTLARDIGFQEYVCNTETSNDFCVVNTEIAEVAAIVLGMCTASTYAEDKTVGNKVLENGSQHDIQLSPELAFLVRYAELQQCFNEGNTQSAVDRLIDLLLTSGDSPVVFSTLGDIDDARTGGINYHLRLRLLSEVRHLLGRNCLRRDQVEILIATLIDLRTELDRRLVVERTPSSLILLLSNLHASLARELANCIFPLSSVIQPSVQQQGLSPVSLMVDNDT